LYEVIPIVPEEDQSLFWSGTDELVMMVSMMSQTAMVQSSYNIPIPTIVNELGNICWCGNPAGELCSDYCWACRFGQELSVWCSQILSSKAACVVCGLTPRQFLMWVWSCLEACHINIGILNTVG